VIAGQLELDIAAAMQDDMLARIRSSVTEPGMTAGKIDAAVEDVFDRLGIGAGEAVQARPCICEQPQVFVSAFADDRRCNLCGREPRR
jgi:hypothetical protein